MRAGAHRNDSRRPARVFGAMHPYAVFIEASSCIFSKGNSMACATISIDICPMAIRFFSFWITFSFLVPLKSLHIISTNLL